MRAINIRRSTSDLVEAVPIELRAARGSGVMDAEPYRRQASGADPIEHRGLLPCAGVRTVVLSEHAEAAPILSRATGLVFVSAGHLEFDDGRGDIVHVGRGGLLLLDDTGLHIRTCVHAPGTRLVEVAVTASPRHQPGEPAGPGVSQGSVNAKVMYRDDHGKSFFREFPELFADSGDDWGPHVPVVGVLLTDIDEGSFLDWHPEVTSNLVLVVNGDLELEVSGDNAIEHFQAGDVVLAADVTGMGHIDRFPQSTSLVVARLQDPDHWAHA